MSSDGAEPNLKVAELVAALSLATDLGLGQPLEHALRSAIISVRLGEAVGLNDAELSQAYYLAFLRFVGCTAAADDMAGVFGDEIAARSWMTGVFFGQPTEMFEAIQRNAGAGSPPAERAQTVSRVLAGLPSLLDTAAAQCEVAQLLADQLSLDPAIRLGLGQVSERWDGLGQPRGLRGEDIPLPVQVMQLAQNVEIYHRAGGVEAARAMARSRAGSAHNPWLVEQFQTRASYVLSDLGDESAWDNAVAAEPGTPVVFRGNDLDRAARAVADFADLKSPFTVGHSRGVSALAENAARRLRLPDADVVAIRRAGLLHDVGRVGVSASIWGKPGPLSRSEWERVRLHPYYTERVFSRPNTLAQLGALASLHHERLDGSGYHRGLPAASLSPSARILAAADVVHALTEARPHRPARTLEQAADEARAGVRAGRLDGDAVAAVLPAAGVRVRPSRRIWPRGLSDREIDVIRLVARGLTDRQMGEALTVSPETVHHHVQHIYDKVGVSTRAAATLFAVQNDLLEATVAAKK